MLRKTNPTLQPTQKISPGKLFLSHKKMASQRGSMVLMIGLFIPILLGVGAIAIELGHLVVVRNELQNAADAAALNGANNLYRPGTFFNGTYDWSGAQNNALLMLQANVGDGQKLTSGDISTGYWNTATETFVSPASSTPGKNDVPAVSVSISKDAGKNGGQIQSLFGMVLGVISTPMTVKAVAANVSPNTINAGGLLPLVVSGCIYNGSWDFTKTPPQPKLDTNGKPIVWSFGPGMSGGSSCGDQSLYTSFDSVVTTPSGVSNLFASGNPRPMSLGSNTYVLDQADNVSSTVIPYINQCSAANPDPAKRTCEYSTVAIVNKTDGAAGYQSIQSFACLHILSATTGGGGNFSISAQLSTLCRNNMSDGISPPSTIFRVRLVS